MTMVTAHTIITYTHGTHIVFYLYVPLIFNTFSIRIIFIKTPCTDGQHHFSSRSVSAIPGTVRGPLSIPLINALHIRPSVNRLPIIIDLILANKRKPAKNNERETI
jgi:hypothetical protein